MTTEVADPTKTQGIVAWAAEAYGVQATKVLAVLKSTCFKVPSNEAEATDAEVAALLIVAKAHNLNPFLKEIFAFRGKNGGIVPVVGVDGWSRIINDHKELNGIEFRYSKETGTPDWIEGVIYRTDRAKPIVVREYMDECKRNTGPWGSHPSRMLRHKALIQAARVAFGFAGIYDEDEAERIVERDVTPPNGGKRQSGTASLKSAVTDGITIEGEKTEVSKNAAAGDDKTATVAKPPEQATTQPEATAEGEKPAKDAATAKDAPDWPKLIDAKLKQAHECGIVDFQTASTLIDDAGDLVRELPKKMQGFALEKVTSARAALQAALEAAKK